MRLKFWTGLSKPRLSSTSVWPGWAAGGMFGSSKFAIDSHLMIHILQIAFMSEGERQNCCDRPECVVTQTSVTIRNVADGFAYFTGIQFLF